MACAKQGSRSTSAFVRLRLDLLCIFDEDNVDQSVISLAM